jgi:hypothetical protein
MKKISVSTGMLLFFFFTSRAQDGAFISPNTNMNIGMDTKMAFNLGNMAGRPFQVNQFDNIKGSPYYIDSFSTCYFTMADGKTYTGIKMRLNLFSNDLHFISRDSTELVVSKGSVKRIAFLQQDKDSLRFSVFSTGYPEVDNNDTYSYYEELASGRILLLKLTRRILQNQRLLTSSPLDKEFTSVNSIYVFAKNKMEKWSKGKGFLLRVLSDKKELVENFIEKEKLKCNSVEDAEKVINYYNQLSLSAF